MQYWNNPFGGGQAQVGSMDFRIMLERIKSNPGNVSEKLKSDLVNAGYLPDSVLNGGGSGAQQGGGLAPPVVTAAPNLAQPGQSAAPSPGTTAMSGSGSLPDPTATLQNAAAVADPWALQRGQYQTQLNNLMQGGVSAIAADPSFQNRLQGGQQAVERSNAARGFLGSGNILTAINDYGQGKASEEYQNQYSRLAQLAGVTAGSPTASASILAQIPGQNLSYSNSAFQQASQGAMLPYQLQALQQGNQAGALQNTVMQNQYNNMNNAYTDLQLKQKYANLPISSVG